MHMVRHAGRVAHPIQGRALRESPAANARAQFNYPDGSVPQKLKEKGVECESILFKDMQHGWCSRGDLSNEAVKRDVAEAMTAIKAFLAKHL